MGATSGSGGRYSGSTVATLNGIDNASRRTAAAVSIEGTLRDGGQTVETSTATLSFVPGHSERKAGLIFTRDPRRHALEVRATGYEEP